MWFNPNNDFLLSQDAGLFIFFPFYSLVGVEMGDKIPSVASLSAHILAAIAKPQGGPSLSDLGRHKKWIYPFSLNFSACKTFLQGIHHQQQSSLFSPQI